MIYHPAIPGLVILLAQTALWSAPAIAAEPADAAFNFGYAIQAMGWCDDFMVNGKTEQTLVAQYSQPMRGNGAALNAEYGRGLERFADDHDKYGTNKACRLAWERVGPSGKDFPGLLMKSPFR